MILSRCYYKTSLEILKSINSFFLNYKKKLKSFFYQIWIIILLTKILVRSKNNFEWLNFPCKKNAHAKEVCSVEPDIVIVILKYVSVCQKIPMLKHFGQNSSCCCYIFTCGTQVLNPLWNPPPPTSPPPKVPLKMSKIKKFSHKRQISFFKTRKFFFKTFKFFS